MVQAKKTSTKAWLVCLIAIFGGIALALVQNKISPIITVLMEVFNINMSTAGILSTIFTFIGLIMALPAAMILKRFGPKRSGLAALLFAVLGSVVGLLTENIAVLIASRVIEGTGIGIIAVLAPTLISMWFPPEKRGLPMGIWGSWMMVSQAVLFFLGAPITHALGWQGMWMLGLVACIIAAVLFLLFVKSPPVGQSNADVESSDVKILEGIKSFSSFTLALAAACFTFCSFTFVSWVSAYWGTVTTWSVEEIGRWVAILYLVEMVYAWIIGGILNKVK
ncbi:MAG: MFS transporter, partial [Coriobacteriales bacterium]|nr:MFS transporter [Coriobacteriales bacterium]